LATRGAHIKRVWHAAALGVLDTLETLLVPGIDLATADRLTQKGD
jgi:hypothetical protein